MERPASAPATGSLRLDVPDVYSPLPPELDRFLREIDRPTILIRGPPGGGKTALALRLLARSRGPTVWVSTRPGGMRNAPRLLSAPNGRAELIHWTDLSIGGSESEGLGPAVAAARRALIERGPGADRGDDAAWLPAALRTAWVAVADDPSLSVVVDSWDGLVDLYLDCGPDPEVPRATLARLLLGHLITRGIRLVLISEQNQEGELDAQVDAVLQIAQGELEERSVRVLTMPKLRGVTRDETIYPFTLEEGAFTYLPRTERIAEYVRFRFEDDLIPKEHGLWPGSRDFAAAFGRLPLGAFSLLEREDAVPSEIPRKISTTMALATLKSGGRVLLVLPPGLPPESVYERFRTVLPEEILARNLRLLGVPMSGKPRDEVREVLVPLDALPRSDVSFAAVEGGRPEDANAPIFPEAVEFLLGSSEDPYPALAVVDVAGLLLVAGMQGRTPSPELLMGALRRSSLGNPIHGIVTGVVGEPLLDALRPLARPFVRLVARRGRIFALGYVPWTAAFALLPPAGPGGSDPYRLLRMS